ncbi:MAG: hypothetical protein ACLTXR_07555 [Clostridia bacterium]
MHEKVLKTEEELNNSKGNKVWVEKILRDSEFTLPNSDIKEI